MIKIQRIVFFVYDGFEILDLSGPASVFEMANTLSSKPCYSQAVVSVSGGLVRSSCGLELKTMRLSTFKILPSDTVFVVGAEKVPLLRVWKEKEILTWIKKSSKVAKRFGSICTGAFLLAHAGILNGKNVTTHWVGWTSFSMLFPQVNLRAENLYAQDGKIWTSGGGAAGIDLALAMIEIDQGAELKGQIAKRLVVYSHRPGHQSQFSRVLETQRTLGSFFSPVDDWISKNLEKKILVSDLAQKMNMTERSFYRKFTEVVGESPAKYVAHRRLELAKELLETGSQLKSLLKLIGFNSEASFRTSFKKRFGMSPSEYRNLHSHS